MLEKVVRSADVMANVLKDPNKLEEIKGNPDRVDGIASDAKIATDATFAIQRRANAIEADRGVYRLTTMFLGLTIVLISAGIIAIQLLGIFMVKDPAKMPVPEALIAIASASVGALAGLLSPLASRN